jgi:hypothetical protein
MKRYVTSFKIATAVISLPCGFLFVVHLANLNALGILFFAGLLSLLWGVCRLLHNRKRFAFGVSLSLAMIIWLPLLYQTIKRLGFVVENGGMEGADGSGSPWAFLVGLVIEQSLFIPLSLIITQGIMLLMRPDNAFNSEESR